MPGNIVPASAVDAVERAATLLRCGEVVGIPTDTVYGLAVDPQDERALDRLHEVKRRPRHVAIAVLVATPGDALRLTTNVPPVAERLMARLWPGAVTVVLDRADDAPEQLGSAAGTVGVRCPDHDLVRRLCALMGPLATTSANLHNEPTLTDAAEVAKVFGDSVALVLDGGTCAGDPSTVVDVTGGEPVLLRPGRISWDTILAAAKA